MATYLNRVDSQVGHSSWKYLGPLLVLFYVSSVWSCAIEADAAFKCSVLPHPSPAKTDDCTHLVCEVVIHILVQLEHMVGFKSNINLSHVFYSYHVVGIKSSSDHHHHQQNKEMLNHVLYT
jgi:hypothetical protein